MKLTFEEFSAVVTLEIQVSPANGILLMNVIMLPIIKSRSIIQRSVGAAAVFSIFSGQDFGRLETLTDAMQERWG